MTPLRFAEIADASGRLLFTTDAGRAFIGSEDFLARYVHGRMSGEELQFLQRFSPSGADLADLKGINHLFRLARRQSVRNSPDYFILVPTLRCNLSCAYCQVSRAALNATEFDWTPQVLDAAVGLINETPPTQVKLEFQGGEPTLRIDLVEEVIRRVEKSGKTVEAVLCTNLMELPSALFTLLDRGNVHISTSIDGDADRQARQRAGSAEGADRFFDNLALMLNRYGPEKISALPTIDPDDPPSYDELYSAFVGRGLNSIFLRPVNFHGFARKRHSSSRDAGPAWSEYHRGFIRYLIARGAENSYAAHEFYFTQLLQRIFRAGANGHVDLRNPSVFGIDYLVIDYDGRIFPTDEARMLDRIGEIDLSLGDVFSGVDQAKSRLLNASAFNDDDPDCIHCAYQPFCGSDPIDAISRYGRIDMPRGETAFCRRQLDLFNFAFSMLASPTESEKAAIARWLDMPSPPPRFLETAP